MLCIASGDGYLQRVNPAFERTLGYSVQELLSRPFLDFVHPEDREKTERELGKLVAGVPAVHFENRYRCRDGSYRWLSWMAAPQENGQRIYAVASDVSQRKRVEAELRASEQRYRQLLEAGTSYTYSLEIRDGVPQSTVHGAGCLAATGYTAEDFAADPYLWISMVHPDDRELVRRHAAQALAERENGPVEHRILHRDGSVRWVRHKIVPHRDGRGRLVRNDGIVEDITERKVIEERFRLLVESAPDAMIVVDGTGKIVLANAQAETQFGYSRDELLGQAVELLVPHGLRGRHAADRAAYAAEPHPRMMGMHPSLSGLRRDGSQFPAEIALNPIGTDQGMLVYVAIRDLTERHRAEKALRDSEERFDLAVRGTDAGIWDWDLRSGTVYFSPRWKSMLGCEDHEVGTDFREWENRIHPEDHRRALATIQDYLEGRKTECELEHRLRHKDGTYRWIIARGAAVRDSTGKPYRMVGSHIDITARKRAEEALRKNLSQLVVAQKIQEHLLPDHPPVLPGFDIAGASYPAEFTAGDHFDFLTMPDHCIGIVVADVAGHGIGPAILMAATHAYLHSLAATCTEVDEILGRANRILVSETDSDRFVTVLFVRLDPRSRTLVYSSAGHPAAYIVDGQGAVRSSLPSTSFPLGVVPDARFPVGDPISLQPGDIALLLTDGLLEATSPLGDQFGQARVIQIVSRNRNATASKIIAALYEAVIEFSGTEKLRDDATIVVIKVDPGD
jgi:PAS domain S-box-containing protein